MDKKQSENKEFNDDCYDFLDDFDVSTLIYKELCRDSKKKITEDIYENLIIETPESKDSIFYRAYNITRTEIEAKKRAKRNVCGFNLKECAYCVIIEDWIENFKAKKAREEKIKIKKLKMDFRMQREPSIFPTILERYRNLKDEIKMNDVFYACFCKKDSYGKRKIILNGNNLLLRIGRRFQNSDMQSLLDFLEKNADVASLCLAYNEIYCSSFIRMIDYLKVTRNILELNLQNNEIREFGIEYLCREPENLRLKMLRLNGNKFGVEASKKIALFISKNKYLRQLDIAEVDQTISSLVYYTTVLRCDQNQYAKSLAILDISRPNPGHMNYLDSAHFATLIGLMLKFNESLIELHLRKCGFSCHDIELILIDAKYNKTLRLLDLNENNIGDHGVEQFANWFTEKPALRGLLLSHNIITSNGARFTRTFYFSQVSHALNSKTYNRSLSFSLPFSRIRILDLSYNRIDDAGVIDILNSIKKSFPMRHLRLFGNHINHPTAKIVERMLVSGVLVQENLDVKPVEVDDKFYFAHYPADHYEQIYYDIPLHP